MDKTVTVGDDGVSPAVRRERPLGDRLVKRSIMLAGHATSVALEPEFWAEMEALAAGRGLRLSALIAEIDAGRQKRPLASACRLAALQFAKSR